mgnify:FL=1
MLAAQINPSSSVLTAAVSIERERPDFPSDKKRRDALVLFNCGLGYSEDFKLRCVTMRLSGMSWSAIEREMGVAQATVRGWVRAAEAKKKQAKEILSDGR